MHTEIGIPLNELIDIRNTRTLEHTIMQLLNADELIDILIRINDYQIIIEPDENFRIKHFKNLLEDLQLKFPHDKMRAIIMVREAHEEGENDENLFGPY